jgi:peptidoglycan hydrolase-like protein with peptidoglycan-binding domain
LFGAGNRQLTVVAVGVAALAIVAAGVAWALASGHPGASASVGSQHAGTPTPPLRVLSVTPASGSQQVNGAAPIEVSFSAPLAADSPMPTITPDTAGTWMSVKSVPVKAVPVKAVPAKDGKKAGKANTSQTDRLVFTPKTAFGQNRAVTVTVPSGQTGVRSAAGGVLSEQVSTTFRTGSYSTLRLQELLAQLGYLPLTWTPSGASPPTANANAQLSAAFDPPAGTFSWQNGYPSSLNGMWAQGQPNMIDVGAIRAFESVEGLTMDGIAGPRVWRDLLRAVARGQDNPNGYTYALASKILPETLTIWHDGSVVLHTLANTGIPQSPTADGTFPVYEKLPFQIMQGTNPDGTHYADPVQNVSYFNGGDAVHYFPRATYGWQQSLGCVELPLAQSAVAYRYLSYGSLVTVAG